MTRIFTDGAEMGDILNIAYSVPSGYVNANTAQKRSGNYSYQIANAVNIFFAIPGSAKSELYVRIGFYGPWGSDTTRYICGWFYDISTIMGSIKINALGKMDLYVGTTKMATGTGIAANNSWNLLEVHIKIDDTVGIIETKLNGLSDVSYSGDTKPSTQTTFSYIAFGASGTWYIDDIAFNDTAGSSDNSWCGDGKIIALIPNANGDLSQLTGSDGNSTDNYLLVDETPSDGDTTYVEGSTVDEKDLYNLSACGLNSSYVDIKRVWVESRSKDTADSGGLIALILKTNSTEYASSDIALSLNYGIVRGSEYLVNPQTGVAWTVTELDALQVGPKTRS